MLAMDIYTEVGRIQGLMKYFSLYVLSFALVHIMLDNGTHTKSDGKNSELCLTLYSLVIIVSFLCYREGSLIV